MLNSVDSFKKTNLKEAPNNKFNKPKLCSLILTYFLGSFEIRNCNLFVFWHLVFEIY